jgi:MFS family permease
VAVRDEGHLGNLGTDIGGDVRDHDQRRNQRILITLSYWASTLAEGSARIIIPLYFADIGISPFSIGLSFFFFEAFGLLANIYGGFFINYYGYKRAFLISLLLHTVASLGYLLIFPEQAMILSLILVNILRACRGVGKEVIKTASSAYIRQFAPPERRAFSMPIQILLGGKDGIKGLGIVLGGFLLTYLSFKLSFLVLGLVTLVFLLVARRWVEDYRERKQVSYAGFFDVNRKLALLAWSRALLYAGRDFWLVIPVPLYLNELGYSNVSIATVLAVGLIVSGIAQPLSADQVKR